MRNILNWVLSHPTWIVISLLVVGIYIYSRVYPFQAKRYISQRREFNAGFFIGAFNLEDRLIIDLIMFIIVAIWLESPVRDYSLPITQVAMINLGWEIDYRITNILVILLSSIFWGIYGVITNERTRDLGVITSFIFMFNFAGRAILKENSFMSYLIVTLLVIYRIICRASFKEDRSDKAWFSLLLGSVLATVIFGGF